MASVSIFGEPLLELSSTGSGSVLGPAVLGVAGDTLNTSVYLARLGHEVRYVTALGTDVYSDAIVERLVSEGVSTEFELRHPTRTPGLYAIRTDSRGERFFTYWRDQSAARAFFSLPGAEQTLNAAMACDLFYFTGISVSILPVEHRDQLLVLVNEAVRRGIKVAFDGNYRPHGWESESAARACFESVATVADLVLPTSEDDDKLFGKATPAEHASRWRDSGTRCAVVKNGPEGAWVLDGDRTEHVPVAEIVAPRDTTGAGDSFNAAFLAAWLDGRSSREAAEQGNALAARVIRQRGALIPRSAM